MYEVQVTSQSLWNTIGQWMDENTFAGDCITVIMSYLAKCSLIELPADLDVQFEASEKRIGSTNMRVLHWLLEKFPMSGRIKIGWFMTHGNARITWLTILEPGPRQL